MGGIAEPACSCYVLSTMPHVFTNSCLFLARASVARMQAEEMPLFACGVAAGFPSPADDHVEQSLDVAALLVRRPAATFYCRADGPSMRDAGVHDGDILVVDRSLEPVAGDIVVAAVDGGLTVKRLARGARGGWLLAAENPDFAAIPVDPVEGVHIWGVVTWALTSLCQR